MLDCTYVEPFAGGAGVGLALLLHGYVNRIVLNDLSVPVHAFWRAVLDESEQFTALVREVPLTVDEWKRQREIFKNPTSHSSFDLGFATFFLNRTNRSGVLNGGIIGGYEQKSAYKIDARFNREDLASRILRIAKCRGNIILKSLDAADLIENINYHVGFGKSFIYIDPPYYKKGRDLYYDFYREDDHKILGKKIRSLNSNSKWVVSYDNEAFIRDIYAGFEFVEYDLSYSVKNGGLGREIMFFSDGLDVPRSESCGVAGGQPKFRTDSTLNAG